MSRKRLFSMVALATVFALVAWPVLAQSPDYSSTITGSVDTAAPGSTVSYQVDVANVGNADGANEIILDIYLPSGVPCDVNAYLDEDPDATAAFEALSDTVQYTENIFNPDDDAAGVFFGVDSNCENFLLQPQHLMLPAGEEGSWFYDAVMPTPPFTEGVVHVSSATQDADLNYGKGGCSGDLPCTDHPCLGPRISTIAPITGTLELVNGPGGGPGTTPDMGCGSLQGFTAGNIALINRGKCDFEVKVANALFAGATGVLIADSDDFTDSTTEPDDVLGMACTSYCSEELVTIPAAFISYADGQLIHADLDAGNPVTATIGQQEIGNGLKTETYIWENVDTGDDTNGDNDRSSVTTTVSSGGTAPTADFSYVADGLTATFTDASTGDPTSWLWDFGDNAGTSTEQNPVYAYAAAGDYTVSLTATNDTGSDTKSMTVTVAGGTPTLDNFYFVPAAAYASGVGSSFYVTDLDINNGGTTSANYQFLWLPRDTDNASPTASETFTLAAGAVVRFSNVLSEVFDAPAGALGALAIISDSTNLSMMSRTFNQATAGTFGQGLPGYAMANLISANVRKRVLFMTENANYRSNLGLMNGTGTPITIMWERFMADGTSIDTGSATLPAWGNTQLNRVFEDVAPVAGGYVDVWTETENGYFAAYGSVLDATTSDPTTVLPASLDATSQGNDNFFFVPAAAYASGVGSSFYVTDLDINNGGTTSATYHFLWLPRDTDNATPTASDSFTLAAGGVARYSNVLSEVFDAPAGALGALAIVSDSPSVYMMSRTFNQADTGTFGQGLPGYAMPNLIPANVRKRVLFMTENDDYRSNLGLMNGTGTPITIMWERFMADGTSIDTGSATLPAWGNKQLNRVFEDVAPVAGAYVDVWTETENGYFAAYGSVLDATTSDPTTVLPQ